MNLSQIAWTYCASGFLAMVKFLNWDSSFLCGILLHPFARQRNLLKLTVKLDNLRLHILRLYSAMLEESILQRTGFVARKADENALCGEMRAENLSLLHLTLLHTPVYWRFFNLLCLLYLLSGLLKLHCFWIWHFLLLCFAALLSQPQPFSDGWTDVWCILKWFHHFPLAAS